MSASDSFLGYQGHSVAEETRSLELVKGGKPPWSSLIDCSPPLKCYTAAIKSMDPPWNKVFKSQTFLDINFKKAIETKHQYLT